jgi:hypothetical protein
VRPYGVSDQNATSERTQSGKGNVPHVQIEGILDDKELPVRRAPTRL